MAADAEALEAAFAEARARRNEGLMVKDPASGYSPGRRGLGWLKMKKALATIDCVVVGVEVGHGKRHGVLSDYTFAVRDDETGKLVNIGKAYSGLTDAEIAEMTAWFEAHTIARFGRYRQVEPTVVVEIAFDVIVRSKRHGSGFSLRFPRIHALRPDKSPDEIDTVATVTDAVRGPPARQRAAGDGRRQERARTGRLTFPGRTVARYAAAMFEFGGAQQSVQLTLYTDAFVIRGSLETRQRRVSDILNQADDPFLVLSGVTVEEFGPHGQASTAEYAQVNLASVLFAVADTRRRDRARAAHARRSPRSRSSPSRRSG